MNKRQRKKQVKRVRFDFWTWLAHAEMSREGNNLVIGKAMNGGKKGDFIDVAMAPVKWSQMLVAEIQFGDGGQRP